MLIDRTPRWLRFGTSEFFVAVGIIWIVGLGAAFLLR
jgi:hypothetical protein